MPLFPYVPVTSKQHFVATEPVQSADPNTVKFDTSSGMQGC